MFCLIFVLTLGIVLGHFRKTSLKTQENDSTADQVIYESSYKSVMIVLL